MCSPRDDFIPVFSTGIKSSNDCGTNKVARQVHFRICYTDQFFLQLASQQIGGQVAKKIPWCNSALRIRFGGFIGHLKKETLLLQHLYTQSVVYKAIESAQKSVKRKRISHSAFYV